MAERKNSMPTFKCVLIGDNGPTKETFMERLICGGFPRQEVNAQGVKILPMLLHTNCGTLRFMVWDATGAEMYEALREGERIRAECAVIMFDGPYRRYGRLLRAYEDLPTVICASRPNLKKMLKKKSPTQYFYDIGFLTKYCLMDAFQWIASELVGFERLDFVPMRAIYPPEVKLSMEERQQMQRDLLQALKTPLPPDDGIW